MAVTLLLAALVAQQTSTGPSVQQVRSAIWADIELNATIGNGNDLVSWDWFFGEDREHPPKLTMVGLKCSERAQPYRCAFNLARDANAAAPSNDKAIGADLRCTASFKWSQDESRWVVIHFPPPKHRGHTRTSMRCTESLP
jgi:hypothetical protein